MSSVLIFYAFSLRCCLLCFGVDELFIVSETDTAGDVNRWSSSNFVSLDNRNTCLNNHVFRWLCVAGLDHPSNMTFKFNFTVITLISSFNLNLPTHSCLIWLSLETFSFLNFMNFCNCQLGRQVIVRLFDQIVLNLSWFLQHRQPFIVKSHKKSFIRQSYKKVFFIFDSHALQKTRYLSCTFFLCK